VIVNFLNTDSFRIYPSVHNFFDIEPYIPCLNSMCKTASALYV